VIADQTYDPAHDAPIADCPRVMREVAHQQRLEGGLCEVLIFRAAVPDDVDG
jgi:hypothetical protein